MGRAAHPVRCAPVVALAAVVTKAAKVQESSALLSMHWYRVASLKPKLAPGVSLQRHFVRERHWHLLSRDDHAGQVRLNQAAWSIVGRCNGRSSLASIWQTLAEQEPDRLPSQQDLLPLLADLIKRGMLVCNDWPDLDQRDKDHRDNERKQGWQQLNPLAPRWPIGDPSRAIARLAPVGQSLMSPAGTVAIVILVTLALLTVWQHWNTLSGDLSAAMGTARFWLITWCVYPLIKALHELAHGVVLRRYGGRTPVFGLSLLMFMPAPYVDASETDQLSNGRERALVSAAGILAEIIIAAGAIVIWAWSSHGLLSEILMAIALIGSVSTVAFNANPLIRFDGYYVLTDLTGLANLAERSKSFWQNAMHRRILGIPTREVATTKDERPWLMAYAPASWLYRLTILLWLSSWLGAYSRVAGLAVIMLALTTLVLMPIVRLLRAPMQAGAPLARIGVAQARFTVLCLGLIALGLIPVPDRTLVQAVAWAPDGTRIKANQPGFIESVAARDGELVVPGQPLFRLKDPQLEAEVHAQLAQIARLESEWQDELTKHSAQMTGRREMLAQAYRRLDHLRQNESRLTIFASQQGRFRLAGPTEDLPGRFVKAGDLLAYVQTEQAAQLRAVLTETQANQVRKLTHEPVGAQVRSGNGRGSLIKATVLSLSPDAIDALPSNVLSVNAGGTIQAKQVNQRSAKTDSAMMPLHPSYQLNLQLADSTVIADSSVDAQSLIPGQRVWVRLDMGWRPLLSQVIELAGQAFNARMAPGWS